MDERIINMVSLIAGQVQTKQDLFRKEETIITSLLRSGYRLHEADAALTLMQSLVPTEDDGLPGETAAGMRAMNAEERARFSIDAFSFVTKLARLGIITDDQQEDILERAMILQRRRVGLAQMKDIVALHLFADERSYEEILAFSREQKGTTWN